MRHLNYWDYGFSQFAKKNPGQMLSTSNLATSFTTCVQRNWLQLSNKEKTTDGRFTVFEEFGTSASLTAIPQYQTERQSREKQASKKEDTEAGSIELANILFSCTESGCLSNQAARPAHLNEW